MDEGRRDSINQFVLMCMNLYLSKLIVVSLLRLFCAMQKFHHFFEKEVLNSQKCVTIVLCVSNCDLTLSN
jgi:hypothetical protein